MIKVQNLNQDFLLPGGKTLRVLHDLNLTLPSSKTIAIVGQSGSGKTTLLSLLAGLEAPTQGTVEVFGTRVDGLDEEGCSLFRARNIGIVFQNFQLLSHFSALANVALACKLSGMAGGLKLAQEELMRVGLGERLEHFPSRLSGGESQRVAVARALVTRPKLLLCDEPTGSLDPENAEAIISILLNAKETHNTTVLIVTHDMELAKRCDVQVTLSKGRVVHQSSQVII
jgi:putative ABC transport system ATP-binding protein